MNIKNTELVNNMRAMAFSARINPNWLYRHNKNDTRQNFD